MHNSYNTNFCCDHCGNDVAIMVHRYLASYTYQNTAPCVCNIFNYGIAWSFRYTNFVVWEDCGYFADGRFHIEEHVRIGFLNDEDEEPILRCNECFQNDSLSHWDNHLVSQDVVDGPDAWTLMCDMCKKEAKFAWSEPHRRGLIVPLSVLDSNLEHVWVDPGFRYRKVMREAR